jgi:quinol monooxygenase YgiN
VGTTELRAIVRFRFHPGEVDVFKRLSEQCMEIVPTQDAGTLQYGTFFNDDETECIVIERFRDSDALIQHGENLAHLMDAITGTGSVSGELLGDLSAELRSRFADDGPVKLFTPWLRMSPSGPAQVGASVARNRQDRRSESPTRVVLLSHDVKLHAIDERVVVNGAGMRSASTKRLKVGLSRSGEVLVCDRRKRQQLDLVDLYHHGNAPVDTSDLDLGSRPKAVGERDRSVCYSIANVWAELHAEIVSPDEALCRRFWLREARSHRTTTIDLVVGADSHGEDACDRITSIVPTVTGTVEHNEVARAERHFHAVVELETDHAFEDQVVVMRRRTVHPSVLRVSPSCETIADELMEVVALGRQLHQGRHAATRRRERRGHLGRASVVRKSARLVATP